jgi:hypothetical protein
MYSSTLSLTYALDEGWWSTPRPGRFSPGKNPVLIVQEALWAPWPVWTGAENPAPTGIWFLDRPARSESLYRLSYPGSHLKIGYRVQSPIGILRYFFIWQTSVATSCRLACIIVIHPADLPHTTESRPKIKKKRRLSFKVMEPAFMGI